MPAPAQQRIPCRPAARTSGVAAGAPGPSAGPRLIHVGSARFALEISAGLPEPSPSIDMMAETLPG